MTFKEKTKEFLMNCLFLALFPLLLILSVFSILGRLVKRKK